MPGMPRAGEPLVRRWIGAGRRRASRESQDARDAGAEVITLTWAQTFGRGTASQRPDGVETDEAGRIVVLGDGRTSS